MTTPQFEELFLQKRVAADAGLYPADLSKLSRDNPTAVSSVTTERTAGDVVVDFLGEKRIVKVSYAGNPSPPSSSDRYSISVILEKVGAPSNKIFLLPWFVTSVGAPYRGGRFFSDDNVQSNNLANGTWNRKTGIWYGKVRDFAYVRVRHFSETAFNLQYEYDVRVHHDGRVEFGYAPLKDLLGNNSSPSADLYEIISIGALGPAKNIAAQNSAAPLTERDRLRGGQLWTVTPVFTNREDWPATRDMGATYTFLAPKETRKVLPRLQVRTDDSNSTLEDVGLFDDTTSAAFVEQPVNFPTTLPRLFGKNSTKGQPAVDLYTDMDLTANINPSSFGDWQPRQEAVEAGFSEVGLYDQDHKYDAYYSGSSPSDVGTGGFSGNLGQKDRIVLEYDIEFPTQLQATASSLLYYDTRSRTFKEVGEVSNPRDYFTVHGDAKLFTAFGTMVMSGGYGYPGQDYSTYYDHYFDLTASPVTSSISTAPFTMPDPWSYGYFSDDRINKSFQHTLIESPTIGKKYSFNENEVSPISFAVPGDRNFLVEKVVIEMPFEAGPGWLNDKTTSNLYMFWSDHSINGPGPVTDYSKEIECIDVGGPCVTVGLLKETRNNKLGSGSFSSPLFDTNYSPLRRDVICSGTLIPPEDVGASYYATPQDVLYNITPNGSMVSEDQVMWVANQGYRAHVGAPTAVLHQATSSVKFEMKTGFSSVLYYSYGVNDLPKSLGGFGYGPYGGGDSTQTNPVDAYGYGSEYLDMFVGRARIHGSKPHGSSMAGLADNFWLTPSRQLEPPGRRVVDSKESLYARNVAYSFADALSSSLNSNTLATYYAQSGFVGNFIDNPYLLCPGDRLTVFLSKFRSAKVPGEYLAQPRRFNVTPTYPLDNVDHRMHDTYVSFWSSHDIKVSSGKLKVTLYGSYVGEARERHPSPPPSKTAALSTVIGDEPVLDQFDLTSPQDRLGTYYDNFMAAKYVTPPSDIPAAAQLLNRKRISGGAFGANPYYNTDNRGSYLVPGVSVGDVAAQVLAAAAKSGSIGNYYFARNGGIGYSAALFAAVTQDIFPYITSWSNVYRPLSAGMGVARPLLRMFSSDVIEDSLQLDTSRAGLRALIGYLPSQVSTFTPAIPSPGGGTVGTASTLQYDLVDLGTAGGIEYISSFPVEYAINNGVNRVLTNSSADFILKVTAWMMDASALSYAATHASKGDVARTLFGFNNDRAISMGNDSGTWSLTGDNSGSVPIKIGPQISGWRYGMNLGMSNPSCVFYARHYGHLRDMLEQRPVTATIDVTGVPVAGGLSKDDLNYAAPWGDKPSIYNNPNNTMSQNDISPQAVGVKFYIRDTDGKYLPAKPEQTASGNLDEFYRSYAPFIEDQTRDRDYSVYPLLDLSYIVVSP